MKIEVGKVYEVLGSTDWFDKGDVVRILDMDEHQVHLSVNGEHTVFLLPNVERAELKEIEVTTKPAHYDTAIDTIAFAKANFTPEQVEGFMRINAIKYLQRAGKKDDKLSDLRKSAHYLQMLIEMEEGK